MLKLRKKLGEYQEFFYWIFILAMTGMNSAGLNSEDRIYKVIFVVATLFLLLKMAVTDFTLKEILVMAIFTVLLGTNLLRNGEKTVILTAMGIFGAKNVSLEKTLKYALWLKTALTVGTLTLAALGVIENATRDLPKNDEMYTIHCYGYYHPNMAFANIMVLLLLAILVYGDRLKWYAYAVGTVIILAAYKVFFCRTGLVIWAVLCLMVLGYRLTRRWKWEKVYMTLLTFVPVVLAALTLILPLWARKNEAVGGWLDFYLTGRIRRLNEFLDGVGVQLLGHVPREPFDSIYFHLLYNYGWVLFVLCILAYCAGMWYCSKKCKFYETIGMGIMAVYGFMEHLPLSVLWNLPLLYLSWILFKERKATDEQLQQKVSDHRDV